MPSHNDPPPIDSGLRSVRLVLRRGSRRLRRLNPTVRGMIWTALAGFIFSLLNATMRWLALELHPFQAQFLRYLFGALVMFPLIVRTGFVAYRPNHWVGQLWRGALHTLGLSLWFLALPRITLADMTAIGFTGPIFIMIGAIWFLKEPARWDRWLAAGLGLAGVMVVVGPQLSGSGGLYHLLMLASSPVFAASFLLTKVLTRYDRPEVIVVWQSITVTLFSLPMALLVWKDLSLWQWFWFVVCGALGSAGHYCLTRSFGVSDISSTQSVKFLDLLWASLLGWLIFADIPASATLIGALVILGSTLWLARRESRRASKV
ncbi:MAG: DMT family transporter [Betaproteobacteria bacterium]|nr:DMT family transporter [Betaproteobacteria bacterium]NBY56101.1 DMT family transporter [Betaproteobacteria bacterium]NDA92339.1 DMT family transporter [Betaproteobacteria bacterium]NDC01492.1 DMT family transporter [Betaproteobacteria bacterium]NDC84309.1 DMT family transporter [Betaproteobacteria bacterium]